MESVIEPPPFLRLFRLMFRLTRSFQFFRTGPAIFPLDSSQISPMRFEILLEDDFLISKLDTFFDFLSTWILEIGWQFFLK